MDRMVTAKEVAAYTRMSLQVIYRKTQRNELPHYRSGRAVRYKLKEIDDYMRGGNDAKKDRARRRSDPAD